MEMPGLGGVGVVSEHGQGGGFSRDTGARICPCSPPPLGGGCCWWWCGFRGCWLQSAVLALCIHCRVLSVQGGWFFFLLPRGKRKGRRARKGGDEVWALALAGGVGAGAWFTRRVREDRVRVPRGALERAAVLQGGGFSRDRRGRCCSPARLLVVGALLLAGERGGGMVRRGVQAGGRGGGGFLVYPAGKRRQGAGFRGRRAVRCCRGSEYRV